MTSLGAPLLARTLPWLLFYVLAAACITGGVWVAPWDYVVGQPSPDQMDTLLLRWLVDRGLEDGVSKFVYFPVGYPVAALIPNWIDHLLALPLWRLFGFPLGENAFYTLVLAANGLAAHQLGARHGAGPLCGLAFLLADGVLREADLGHAPQTMLMAAPLYVWALQRTLAGPGPLGPVVLGASMALSGLIYWYQALFLAALSVPVVLASLRDGDVGGKLLRVGGAALLAVVVVAWPLADALDPGKGLAWRGSEDVPRIPALKEVLPVAHQFTFAQAPDVLWWLLPGLDDRSARVPWVLWVAAALGARRHPHPWRWWAAAALGAVMMMGPYLKLGSQPLLLAGHPIPLPGYLLAEASALYGRLTWPARWAFIIPLALLPLAARAPRPRLLAGLLVLETLVLSHHLPLGRTPVGHTQGWAALADAPGAVLTLPPDWTGPRGPHLGLIAPRLRSPLAVSILVSASSPQPDDWVAWQGELAIQDAVLGRSTERDPAVELVSDGIAAVAVDATPGGRWTEAELVRWNTALTDVLGEGIDYGSVLVWWLTPPPDGAAPGLEHPVAWRASWRQRLAEEQGPDRPGEGFRPYRWATGGPAGRQRP